MLVWFPVKFVKSKYFCFCLCSKTNLPSNKSILLLQTLCTSDSDNMPNHSYEWDYYVLFSLKAKLK